MSTTSSYMRVDLHLKDIGRWRLCVAFVSLVSFLQRTCDSHCVNDFCLRCGHILIFFTKKITLFLQAFHSLTYVSKFTIMHKILDMLIVRLHKVLSKLVEFTLPSSLP